MTTTEFLQREIRRVELSIRRAERKQNAPQGELRGLHEKLEHLQEAREAMKKRPQCSCFLPIAPPRTTHQQKKVAVVHGKPIIYQPSRLKNAVSVLGWSLAPHKPKEPLKGPLALVVRWKFHGQKKKPGWKITRPDTDNLQKALKDEMGKLGFYQDDAQVVHEECEKVWADVPGIEIKLWELEP